MSHLPFSNYRFRRRVFVLAVAVAEVTDLSQGRGVGVSNRSSSRRFTSRECRKDLGRSGHSCCWVRIVSCALCGGDRQERYVADIGGK